MSLAASRTTMSERVRRGDLQSAPARHVCSNSFGMIVILLIRIWRGVEV